MTERLWSAFFGSRFDSKERGEFFVDAFDLGPGEVLSDGGNDGFHEFDDIDGGVAVGRAGGEIVGELSLEEPARGTPVAFFLCRFLNGHEEIGLEIDLRVGDFFGELGVASGGVGNGGRYASDGSGGSASAAAVG